MIKRVIASLALMICLCPMAWANQEVTIKLDNKERVCSERLGFAYITFEYVYNSGNTAKVRVSVENITQTPPLAVLVFRRDLDERLLKQGKPKIEFEKKYPGEKGKRRVRGCDVEYYKYLDVVTAAETDTLFTLDVSLTSARDITLPLYVAKYKPKDLFKKGEDNITYKIVEEYVYDIHIEVVGWSEEDPTYLNVKNSVDQFVSSLKDVEFCPNKRHRPSLREQQRPYQAKRDSLINAVSSIIEANYGWMSTDAPHKAYTKLLEELNKVDLDSYVSDCGDHETIRRHKCGYCPLSAQELYYRLDDLYQKLHAGRVTKDQALKTAKGLYNCYRLGKNRRKDDSYGGKITRFYDRIAGY